MEIIVAFQDVKVPFMMQIELKFVLHFLNYQEIQHCGKNRCKL